MLVPKQYCPLQSWSHFYSINFLSDVFSLSHLQSLTPPRSATQKSKSTAPLPPVMPPYHVNKIHILIKFISQSIQHSPTKRPPSYSPTPAASPLLLLIPDRRLPNFLSHPLQEHSLSPSPSPPDPRPTILQHSTRPVKGSIRLHLQNVVLPCYCQEESGG
jgi:hypothetical protein